MNANESQQTKASEQVKQRFAWRIQDLAHGRSWVQVDGGALEHTDQLRLSSEVQRERFAQACEAKTPGCFDDVLAELEKQATRRRSHYNPRTDEGCRFIFTSLDKIASKPVDWLWEKYIPAGCVTILEGDPGVGKTMVLADLAARVSRGFLAPDRNPAFDEPGFDPEPMPDLVWWFAGQDGVEEILAPRLRAAGANASLVRVIEGTEDMMKQRCRKVSFPDDFDPLWKCKGSAPRLVIVDPLSAVCGGSLHHATAVKVMREFARFAEATGAAVVVVRPLNRRVGALAAERGTAGASLTAEARSVLLLANDPRDPHKQILAPVKCNLCAKPSSLELEIVDEALFAPRKIVAFRSAKGHDSPSADGEQQRLPPRGGGVEGVADDCTIGLPEEETFRGAKGDDVLANEGYLNGPRVAWIGPSSLEADELVKTNRPAAEPSGFEQKKVEEWLGDKLKAGPKLAKEIDEQAKLDDVPPILLRRAKISLGIIPAGSNGSTKWSLPETSKEFEVGSAELEEPFEEKNIVAVRSANGCSSELGDSPKRRRKTANRGGGQETPRVVCRAIEDGGFQPMAVREETVAEKIDFE